MPTGQIVPDTSAWVEYLRATGSVADDRIDRLLAEPERLIVTGPVKLELLAGARTAQEHERLGDLLARCEYAQVKDPEDYEDAALVYRTCAAAGRAVRSHLDCLIAVVAMRIGAAVIHRDADFDVIAEHAPLEIV